MYICIFCHLYYLLYLTFLIFFLCQSLSPTSQPSCMLSFPPLLFVSKFISLIFQSTNMYYVKYYVCGREQINIVKTVLPFIPATCNIESVALCQCWLLASVGYIWCHARRGGNSVSVKKVTLGNVHIHFDVPAPLLTLLHSHFLAFPSVFPFLHPFIVLSPLSTLIFSSIPSFDFLCFLFPLAFLYNTCPQNFVCLVPSFPV
jgi:hypothetical protein